MAKLVMPGIPIFVCMHISYEGVIVLRKTGVKEGRGATEPEVVIVVGGRSYSKGMSTEKISEAFSKIYEMGVELWESRRGSFLGVRKEDFEDILQNLVMEIFRRFDMGGSHQTIVINAPILLEGIRNRVLNLINIRVREDLVEDLTDDSYEDIVSSVGGGFYTPDVAAFESVLTDSCVSELLTYDLGIQGEVRRVSYGYKLVSMFRMLLESYSLDNICMMAGVSKFKYKAMLCDLKEVLGFVKEMRTVDC